MAQEKPASLRKLVRECLSDKETFRQRLQCSERVSYKFTQERHVVQARGTASLKVS
jgi:hypothetical protein